MNITQPPLILTMIARCGLQKKTTLSFFFTLTHTHYFSFWDAGKNSSSGAISGNTGEKGDPCREKAEGGIHYKVTL